jgi:hypothetical protein
MTPRRLPHSTLSHDVGALAHACRRLRRRPAPGEGPQVGGTSADCGGWRAESGVHGGVDGGVGFSLHRCGAAFV